MKKIFLFIPFVIILILNCTVNDSTGVIKVENRTYVGLTNVKIGNTLIAGYVAPGNYVNYWYYKTLSGKLTTEGIPVNEEFKGENLTLNLGCWVQILAKYNTDNEENVYIFSERQDDDSSDNDVW